MTAGSGVLACVVFVAATLVPGRARAADDWFDTLIRMKQAGDTARPTSTSIPLPDIGSDPCTIAAWVRTKEGGPIVGKTAEKGRWRRNGKAFFIRDGRLAWDIGWVGCVEGESRVADGDWHHVAVVAGNGYTLYVDGNRDGWAALQRVPDPKGSVLKIGRVSTDFPEEARGYCGAIDDVRVYDRALDAGQVRALAEGKGPSGGGLVARWTADGDLKDASGCGNHAEAAGRLRYTKGRSGEAFEMDRDGWLIVRCADTAGASPWRELAAAYTDETSRRQIGWEREDGIWAGRWKALSWGEAAHRYAAATKRPASMADQAKALAAKAKTLDDLHPVRRLYLASRRCGDILDDVGATGSDAFRRAIRVLYAEAPSRQKDLLARLDALESQAAQWTEAPPSKDAVDGWKASIRALRRNALFDENPLIDFDKLLFVRRYTFQSTHFYTDFIDGCARYGGNLSVLDLATGEVTDLIPEMADGIFDRFDLHFSATKIVFDWKRSPKEGFRLFEIDIDPHTGRRTGGPRQVTFPPADEAARIAKYGVQPKSTPGPAPYWHQTDDMHPCYLPDGGIAFTSTRCEYGTLCDGPDILSTAVIHRMDGDGRRIEQLTRSAVSEFCPTMLADGRILYTRWEYVDKGQLGVKCLWAMCPDGTGSVEVYGNDIPFPPSFMYGRQVPVETDLFVFTGAPHYPQGGSFGTIIRADTSKDIRTRAPMTYITPNVDVRQEPGWNQQRNGRWVRDQNGPLYTDPYPLSRGVLLVSHNPDKRWNDVRAYGLYLLDDAGNHVLVYQDEEFTCRQPYPLRPRKAPPVIPPRTDPALAGKNLAVCVVQDISRGMTGVERGDVRYIRVMEQIPRPWDSRRFWDPDDRYDRHTHLISEGTALGGKAMWGVVPVEKDGSAHFYVPADRNIYFQALDANYMELQRERTYVNYRPGEKRACVGCHERPGDAPDMRPVVAPVPLALARGPSRLQPQPGDDRPQQVLHYPTYVQPVLDEFCVRCHGGQRPAARLDLTGTLTTHFNRSYERLVRLVRTPREAADFDGTAYLPPKSIGSHVSPLIRQVRKGCSGMDDPLPEWAFVRLATWVDAAGIYYGSYWGRRHSRFKDHPYFRIVPTFEQAIGPTCPFPKEER